MQRNQRRDEPNVWKGHGSTPSRERQAQQHDPHTHFQDSLRVRTHVARSIVTCAGPSAARVRITGIWATGSEKGRGLNHSRHFSGVVGVDVGTCMSFCRDDWANMTSLPWKGSCDSIPSSYCFIIIKARPSVSVDGPSLKVIASFAC